MVEMKSNSKTVENFRKRVADEFIKVLEEDGLEWKKGFSCSISAGGLSPVNHKGKRYKGINQLYLFLISKERGYKDNRWYTFNQVQSMGLHLKDASGQGVMIQYTLPYDREKKHFITWAEIQEREDETKDNPNWYAVYPKTYIVFNGTLVEGLEQVKQDDYAKLNPTVGAKKIFHIGENMGVEIDFDGGGYAYYSPSSDSVHLPDINTFHGEYELNTVLLHELAHATGNKQRLNRDQSGSFGTPAYAKEELVAEITACFMANEIGFEPTSSQMSNHKAYVQEWIKEIKEKPESLANALKDADKATDYLVSNISKQENELENQTSFDIRNNDILAEEVQKTVNALDSFTTMFLESGSHMDQEELDFDKSYDL